jgi:hypothetical protein
MIFSRKNAGKWVASKGDRVVASSPKLQTLMKKVNSRADKEAIRFDLIGGTTALNVDRAPAKDLFSLPLSFRVFSLADPRHHLLTYVSR